MANLKIVLFSAISIATRILNIASIILFSQLLSPVEFGLFAFVQGSAATIAAIATFNMAPSIIVIISKSSSAAFAVINTILASYFATLIIASSAIAYIVYFIAFPQTQMSRSAIFYFAIISSSSATQVIANSVLIARRQKVLSAAIPAIAAAMLVASLYFYKITSLDAALALSAFNLAVAALVSVSVCLSGGMAINLDVVAYRLRTFIIRNGRSLVRFSLLTFVASAGFQLSLWILQRQLIVNGGGKELAIFSLASQFYNVVIFIPGVLGPVLLQNLVQLDSIKLKARVTIKIAAACSITCATGIILFSFVGPIILKILPEKYNLSSYIVMLGISAGALMFVKFPFSVFYQSQLAVKPELFSSLCASLFVIVGAMYAPFTGSAEGALWLRLGGHLMQFIVIVAIFIGSVRR